MGKHLPVPPFTATFLQNAPLCSSFLSFRLRRPPFLCTEHAASLFYFPFFLVCCCSLLVPPFFYFFFFTSSLHPFISFPLPCVASLAAPSWSFLACSLDTSALPSSFLFILFFFLSPLIPFSFLHASCSFEFFFFISFPSLPAAP